MIKSSILILHITTSVIACIITCIIFYRSITGLLQKKEASKWDVKLPFWTTVLLYAQFALGTTLFIFYMVDYNKGNIDLVKNSDFGSRFWPVEHFILMVFTVVMSHVGWIFARYSRSPKVIFTKNLIYFGVACLMIMLSMSMNVIRHAL